MQLPILERTFLFFELNLKFLTAFIQPKNLKQLIYNYKLVVLLFFVYLLKIIFLILN
jgi:hypothetical protein